MNQDTAIHILTNLRERAEESSSSVVLTATEVIALQILFGTDEQQLNLMKKEEVVERTNTDTSQEFTGRVLKWRPPKKIRKDLILCLDFGTSLSKAYACASKGKGKFPQLIDIELVESDDPVKRYFLPSELFIHEGRIHFGAAARSKFEIVEASQNRLIDSPKQYMTLGTEVANLHQKPLRSEQDPSQSLSQRDALVLYLSHLNYLAEKSLENQGLSTDIRRRYAHPAWDKTTADANSRAMARVMAEAVALSRVYSVEFLDSMSLETAKQVTLSVRASDDENLPFGLLIDPVLEATAAGAGALMMTQRGRRKPYVVLDIGAGTTDISGCLCVNNPKNQAVRVWEVTGARETIPMAGNIIDSILLNEILKKCSAAEGTTEYSQVHQALRKTIRTHKETLFVHGTLSDRLVSGEDFEIKLSQFLKIDAIERLFGKIKTAVTDAAFKVVGDDAPVTLVATGGGANLPVVEDLVSGPIRKNGGSLKLQLRHAMPNNLRAAYPELNEVYPQLAVAIGGAHPELAEQMSSIDEGIRDPGPITLGPVYRS